LHGGQGFSDDRRSLRQPALVAFEVIHCSVDGGRLGFPISLGGKDALSVPFEALFDLSARGEILDHGCLPDQGSKSYSLESQTGR